MTLSTPIKYRYAMSMKLSQLGATPANFLFPHIEDLVISSKHFEEFDDAVKSVNALVDELTGVLNTSMKFEKYKMISEINPKFSSKETISKDWGNTEVAKLWIVDKIRQETTPGPILAVALAQLLEVPGEAVLQH
jgi:hypothetical protein